MKTIVSVAMNPAVDKSSSVEHVIPEHKLYCNVPQFDPGGGGVNVSRAIKKLGGESLLFYPSGGLTGKRLEDLLQQENINHQPIPIEGAMRENLIIFEESTGQQFRFGMPGPFMNKPEWEKCLDDLLDINPKPDFLVISGSLPPGVPLDFYARIAKKGKESGIKVVVDASGEALKLALQEGVYLVKPNIREFKELLGSDVQDESQIEFEATKMIERGWCEVLVISLGAAGALMVSRNTVEYIRPPTVQVVSKVGAGDSMLAGIVLSLSRGITLRNSILFGIAAGSAAVMTPGTELCRRDDTERLYKKILFSTKSI